MPKPIQGNSAFSLNLAPLVLLVPQLELIQVVVSSFSIITPKHVHRPLIQHSSVIGPRRRRLLISWRVSSLTNRHPSLLINIEVKQVVKVSSLLALVTPKEVKTIHISHTSST